MTTVATVRRRVGLAVFGLAIAACGLDVVTSGNGPPLPGIDAGPETSAALPEAGTTPDAADAAIVDSGQFPCDAAACVDEISADYTHTCAAIRGARPRCWGNDSDGQLGLGLVPDGGADLDASSAPRTVAVGSPMTGVSVGGLSTTGYAFSCSHTASGAVSCWGQDNFGQRGSGDAGGAVVLSVPTAAAIGSAVDVQAGGAHACARAADGGLSCWGYDNFGQLGRIVAGNIDRTPGSVTLRAAAEQVATGEAHTCARFADGTIDCWGYDGTGQLGRGGVVSASPDAVPAPVSGVAGAIDMAAGYGHTCAALAGGSVMCWGYDSNGQLGRGSPIGFSTTPAAVMLPAGASAISVCAGYLHSCALLVDGTVTCWGYNDKGQLGSGMVVGGTIIPSQSAAPVAVTGLTGARAITCGGHHTCAIIQNSQAVCWGANDVGQLGAGLPPDALPRPTPVSVAF
ncbi:MAG: regulator of chromosome condensation [Myxococcaceae bacterium]|nr:regulator of chromosome condensation [Myxococcaceae bacterium]